MLGIEREKYPNASLAACMIALKNLFNIHVYIYIFFFVERENTTSRGRQTDNPQIIKKSFYF